MWLFAFITSAVILFAWISISSQQVQALIAERKRQLRLWVIRHSGERAMQSVTQELYNRAVCAGHDPDLVKEIIQEDWDIICDRLGRPLADEILGEPSPLERYG
jgi:hypothetical protein